MTTSTAQAIENTTEPGYICKECSGPSPVGIGYVSDTTPRDENRTACDCGYSVRPTRGTATYSPDDNKLRFYPLHRLDREDYDRIKAAGFKWAPKQELFVAPAWTPGREDLLIEWCGEIDDEDTSLVDRAEERADRFGTYQQKRAAEADRTHAAVNEIANGIPLGQPILIGHHSERRARKDAERIQNGMSKAVKLWETSQYWKSRAVGAIAHAKYKELPQVRARRIKTIEADQRKAQREIDKATKTLAFWEKIAGIEDAEQQRATALNLLNGFDHYSVILPNGERSWSGWGALEDNKLTVADILERRRAGLPPLIAHQARWVAHYANRLTYERAMLEEQGATQLLAKKPRKVKALLPIMNYRAPDGIECRRLENWGEPQLMPQVEMTKAAYAAIHNDYKATRTVAGTHRVRSAMQGGRLVVVYLTDSKDHGTPAPKAEDTAPAVVEQDEPEAIDTPAEPAATVTQDNEPQAIEQDDAAPTEASQAEKFAALKATLRQGVQVVAVPQLFPTPQALAARVVALAGIKDGDDVLEPSAGTGALLEAIPPTVANATAVEINPSLAARLCASELAGRVVTGDFLDATPEQLGLFDQVIMNPPFKDAADIEHIKHAMRFLKPGGRLVAICANGPRQQRELMQLAHYWEALPDGTFAAAGTQVNAALLVIEP